MNGEEKRNGLTFLFENRIFCTVTDLLWTRNTLYSGLHRLPAWFNTVNPENVAATLILLFLWSGPIRKNKMRKLIILLLVNTCRTEESAKLICAE